MLNKSKKLKKTQRTTQEWNGKKYILIDSLSKVLMLVLSIYKVAFYTEKWMSAASNASV